MNGKRKFFKYVVYLIAVFLFQEVVVRVLYPMPELSNFDRVNYQHLSAVKGSYNYLRNQNWYWESAPDTNAIFEHRMNQYGFRDEEWEVTKSTNQPRALFIGDSFVEGIMAEQDQTIPSAFKEASGQPDYQVMNAGMLGVGLDSYLQLVADMVPLYQPDVVFLCIYANDLGQDEVRIPETQLAASYFNSWKPRVWEVLEEGSKHGPIFPVWTSDSKPLLPDYNVVRNKWQAEGVSPEEFVSVEMAEHIKTGHFNPYRMNALAKEEYYLQLQPSLGRTISFFSEVCKQNGAMPVVVYIPSRHQVSDHYLQFEKETCTQCPNSIDLTTPTYQVHQQTLAKQCEAQAIPFIDLSATIRAQEAAGNHLYWYYDEHMRGRGYTLVGSSIWEQWQNG